MSNENNTNVVPVSPFPCPPQMRRILDTLLRFSQVDLFGRPQFPKGLIIGEHPNAAHITPDVAQALVDLLQKTGAKTKTIDKQTKLV